MTGADGQPVPVTGFGCDDDENPERWFGTTPNEPVRLTIEGLLTDAHDLIKHGATHSIAAFGSRRFSHATECELVSGILIVNLEF